MLLLLLHKNSRGEMLCECVFAEDSTFRTLVKQPTRRSALEDFSTISHFTRLYARAAADDTFFILNKCTHVAFHMMVQYPW